MTWNSSLQRKTPLHGKKPISRGAVKKGPGLAQRIAESLGRAIQHARGESNLLRSEQHRRNVAALPCACCGKHGPTQCAHINFGKALGRKVCDSLTFPLCPDCHRHHDQGGMQRSLRHQLEWEYTDFARAELIRRNQWPAHVEEAYQRAIVPLARVVHPESTQIPLDR